MGLIAEIRVNGRWERFGAWSDGDEPIPDPRPDANEWREIRARIFARDDYTCQYCGTRGVRLECDHIHPVSKGGSHDDDNLATACFDCNRSKHDKTLDEWQSALGAK